MKIVMNNTIKRILAWILIITINTLLFFGGDNYAWADGIFPNATGSVAYREITIDSDFSTVYEFAEDVKEQIQGNSGDDVEEEEPQDLKDEAISKVASDLLDNAYDNFVEDLNTASHDSVKTITEELPELSKKSSEAAANAQFQRVVMENEAEYTKYADEAAEYMKETRDLASKQEIWKYAENITTALDIISKAADVASLISDAQALANLNGENTATRVIEGVAISADMAVIIIGLCCPGANIPIAASIAVGLFAQIVHNKKVTDWLDDKFDNFDEWWNEFKDGLLDWMKLAIGINCYKPNIYIYPDTDMDVSVKFENPKSLTSVIPDYFEEWDVHVERDGQIYTKEGYTYNYLFYECLTNANLFQTDKGFVIGTEKRMEEFEEILQAYGFTQEEISDFMEFWCEKLEKDKTYVMYPQTTELVDNAMEIHIEPKPDTCVRMWFVFEECEPDTEVALPEIQKIERAGYTVVEWGGMIK